MLAINVDTSEWCISQQTHLDREISHDQITRFLNQNRCDSKDLWQCINEEDRSHETEKGGGLIIGACH